MKVKDIDASILYIYFFVFPFIMYRLQPNIFIRQHNIFNVFIPKYFGFTSALYNTKTDDNLPIKHGRKSVYFSFRKAEKKTKIKMNIGKDLFIGKLNPVSIIVILYLIEAWLLFFVMYESQ